MSQYISETKQKVQRIFGIHRKPSSEMDDLHNNIFAFLLVSTSYIVLTILAIYASALVYPANETVLIWIGVFVGGLYFYKYILERYDW